MITVVAQLVEQELNVGITGCPGMIALRHQHHERRVGGSRHVLQIVGSVRPATRNRDELACPRGVIDQQAIFFVNRITEERIVPRPLLAHV
jgi:hypothetical protein